MRRRNMRRIMDGIDMPKVCSRVAVAIACNAGYGRDVGDVAW